MPVKKTRPQLVTTAAVDMSSKMENHVPEATEDSSDLTSNCLSVLNEAVVSGA